uniref:50S ribosomal protein L9, chloroplastic n=1 Tax=Alexandrium catenella TaxID=2925 RepID=A0A7S1WSX1_ALECA
MAPTTFAPVARPAAMRSRRQSRTSGTVVLAFLAAAALVVLRGIADGGAAMCPPVLPKKQKIKVVLLQDVEKLGRAGDVVEVKRGRMRNCLYPWGLAKKHSDEVMKKFQAEEKAKSSEMSKLVKQAMVIKEKIEVKGKYTFEKKLRQDGQKIYGSLSPTEVAEAITIETGYPVRITAVSVPKGISELGVYSVTVELAEGVTAYVEAEVVAEGGNAKEEEED